MEKTQKVILITGGTDGLGKAIATALAPQHIVIITSPTASKGEAVAKDLGVTFIEADIRNYQSCQNVVASILKKHHQLDCLINNAGVWIQDELDTNDPLRIKETIEVNLLGLIYMTKAVIPQMKVQKQGLIININSQAGWYAKAERSIYNATKWGLTGFTKSLQPELAPFGISVTDIHPGKMKTEMFKKLGIEKSMDDAVDPTEVARVVNFLVETNPQVNIPEIGIKHILG